MNVTAFAAIAAALGLGGTFQGIVAHYLNRKNSDADTTVKIVSASHDFTETVLARLSKVEAKVLHLELENTKLRNQIYKLGHIPEGPTLKPLQP